MILGSLDLKNYDSEKYFKNFRNDSAGVILCGADERKLRQLLLRLKRGRLVMPIRNQFSRRRARYSQRKSPGLNSTDSSPHVRGKGIQDLITWLKWTQRISDMEIPFNDDSFPES